MTVTLHPGSKFLRITLLAPANFGASGGSATVDRPVLLDAWTNLPVLPDSALKGVVAGRLGNVEEAGSLNHGRTPRFGRGDRVEAGQFSQGEPSPVVFGDGVVLCFPCALLGGGTAWVFPAVSLCRFVRLSGFSNLQQPALLRPEEYAGHVAASRLPAGISHKALDLHKATLAFLTGWEEVPDFVITGEHTSERLWRLAVEERTLTAIEEEGTVKSGSLRSVEMIPAGTIFLSYVTNLKESPQEVSNTTRLQVGAWESIGCGFLELRPVDLPQNLNPETEFFPGSHSVGRFPEHEIMTRAYRECRKVAGSEEARQVRTLIREFGPRYLTRGLPETLAFCLAKAKLKKPVSELGAEPKAFRWLLRSLLDVEDDRLLDTARPLITGETLPSPDLETFWRWLSRYSETLIQKG